MKGFDEYYAETVEPGKRERAFAWATAIGLQDVDGLKPSTYLIKTAKRHIEWVLNGDTVEYAPYFGPTTRTAS